MQDWSDLVEYVINKLISSPQCLPGVIPTFSQLETRENTIEDHHPNHLTIEEMPADKEWTEEELDSLNWYFAQFKGTATVSPLEEIARHFQEDGRVMRSPKEIADQLVIQGLLTEDEGVSYLATPTEVEVSLAEVAEEKSDSQPKDDVQFLCHKLSQESPKVIGWLQQVLLECAFIKLRIEKGITSNGDMLRGNCGGLPGIMEPVALIHIREYILQTEFFVQ